MKYMGMPWGIRDVLFRYLSADGRTCARIRPPLPRRHYRLCGFRRLRLPRAGMRHGVFGKAWRCIGACLEICRILYLAGVCAVLDILRRFGDHADQSVCKGVDALSEMVLGVFSAGWYGGGNASNCVRQPTVGERHFLCVDQRGKCLDVRRPSRYDRRGAASAKSGLLIGILVNGKSKRKKEYK